MHPLLASNGAQLVCRLRILLAMHLALGTCALASSAKPKDPFVRSTVFMANYKDQLRPVVSVKGILAQVLVDGKLECLPKDQGFMPFRGKRNIDAFVDVIDQQASSYQVDEVIRFGNGGEINNGTIYRSSEYECQLQTNKHIEDCYIVIMFVDIDFLNGRSNQLKCFVLFHNVGTLEPGKKKKETVSFGFIDKELRQKTAYCPLLFSRGVEVKTTLSGRSDQILARIEALQHDQIVAAYIEKNKGADHQLRAYQQSPMQMPEGTDLTTLPESVNALFTVDGEGRVQAVQIQTPLPPAVKLALVRNIENWLFLPKLEKGYPRPSPVQVPVQLKQTQEPKTQS